MNQKEDIELPLISKSPLRDSQQGDKESQNNKTSSQPLKSAYFTEYIDDSKHPDKYAPPAPFLQWLTFSDMLPYVKQINNSQTKLKFQDLPKPEERFSIGNKLLELDSHWNKELENEKPSFAMALYKTFYGEFAQGTFLFLIDCTAKIFYSIYMGRIINVITQSNFGNGLNSGELQSSGIILSLLVIVSVMAKSWAIYIMAGLIGKARFSISGLLYKKLNSVSLTSIHEIKIGKVMNLLGNDLNDLQGLIALPNLFLTPYLIILGTYMMYNYIEGSTFVALALLMLVLFGQVYLSNQTEEPRKENKKTTDQRVKITHEVIEGIRLIKMYTWDKVFANKITQLRESESQTFLKITHIDALSRNLSSLSVYLIVLIVCLTFIASGGVLSTEILYSTMMILMNLSSNLLSSHSGRMNFVNFKMIVGRVQEVLMIKDILLKEETSAYAAAASAKQNQPLVFKNFDAYWNKNATKPSLSNLNLTFNPGTLTTVIGKIGAGKSTLLLSLLRELPITKGILNITGHLAYVEQDPIIFSGTFRENITFGNKFDEDLYNKVLKDCCLEKDLEMFSHGDMTLIGERGVNLSGGQKARVSLARALYSQSDIYLLDDPFAALDSRVARTIFDRVMKGSLAKTKIVILVTHHLYFARESDHVILMDEGQVAAQGKFEELEKLDISLLNVLKIEEKRRMSEHSRGASEKETEETIKKEKDASPKEKEKTTKEEFADISWGTYKKYLQATGTTKTFLMLPMIFIASHILMIYYSRFLGYWAEEQYRHYNSPDQASASFNSFFYISMCLLMLVVIFLIGYLKTVKLYTFLLSTNTEIHQRMLNSLLRSRVLFFDINPTGRIINRFSNDIGLLDKTNPRMTYDMIDNAISYIAAVVAVCIFNIYILFPSLLVIYGLFHIRKMFDRPMNQVKELELAAKSPMLSAAPTTLHGLIIIRAYNQGGRFIKDFMDMIYDSMRAYIFREKMIRIFGLMLDTPVQFLTLSGIWIFIALISSVNFDSALLGLCLMYLLKIGDQGSLLIRQSLYLDISRQSAQRMLDFCEIESEAPEEMPNKDSQVEREFNGRWPVKGDIVFNKVYLRYRDGLNFALNNLCLDIKGGTKIACVGRTGAGKSSIIQALFRMVEIEKGIDSFIKIDNVDIGQIGLRLLRSRISIIPQTPAIFTGTVKRNLDPLEKLTDFEVWQILSEVGLRDYVALLPEQLHTDMTVSATVFSTGQKQLICLARALINKSKVIILDEATANVDVETDSLIQKTIMTKFKDCTVLTVAHRLITIANYDKAVVIESGCVAEYDSPYRLMVERVGDDEITRKNGLFAEMVKSTGKTMSKTIFQIAHEHYNNNTI